MNYPKSTLAIDGGRPVRLKKNFLVFGSPLIEDKTIGAVVKVLKSRWIGTGPIVHRFEKKFAAFKGAKFAMGLNSCTAALHLSMLASGVGKGDEVITTPMTFCATVNAIIHCGAKPVLADCDRTTMNIDPQEIVKKITKKTKVILVVHFAGRPCPMNEIMAIARKHKLLVIEDCAHALETEYHGRKAGMIGDMGCFSFYVTKNITTGEGGMIITDDEPLAARIKILGLHGMSKDAWKRFSDEGYKHYQVVDAGFKYNLIDMLAVMGLYQMNRIEVYWKKRERIWKKYNQAFADLPCFTPAPSEAGTKHGYHLYTPLIDIDRLQKKRDWVLNALTAENIGVGVHYLPMNIHPFYQKTYGWKPGQFPNAEWIGHRTISLPLSPALTHQDINDTIAAFRKVLGH